MAIPTPYLAAENSAAIRRSRALHRFIVASPIVLLIAVGLVGHVHPRPYAHSAGDAEYDRRVLAYRDRVVAVEAMITEEGESSSGALEEEAARWSSGLASGELATLTPAAYEDHLRDGARGEVLRAGLGIATALGQSAMVELNNRHFPEAARQALLGAEIGHGLRRFEVQAFLQGLLVMRRDLGALAQAWPHLSSAEREAARPRLRAMLVDEGEVQKILVLEHDQIVDYRFRQRISVESGQQFAERSLTDSEDQAAKRSLRIGNDLLRTILRGAPGSKP